jgi:predicted transcriptional regulator
MADEGRKSMEILRERRGPVPGELRQRMREHNRMQKAIADALADGAKTPPEIAEGIDARTDEVFWHLMAMRKYGSVAEGEQDGDYVRYALTQKDKQ